MQITLETVKYRAAEQLVTTEFQQAIDTIAHAGGGTLFVPPGRYLLGTLCLPSHFCLWLQPGAELVASPNYDDFQTSRTLSRAECSDRAMLYARGQADIIIAGTGTIYGSGDAYFSQDVNEQGYRMPAKERPRLIVFEDCQQVRLQDFRIIDAPMWTIHLVACAHIYVDRLSIDNDLSMSNTDALDIDGCEHVWISNSYFSSADDGICLKTTLKPAALRRPTRHVVIQNCILRSYSCAFKIGTETVDDIEDIIMTGCTIYDSNRAIGLVSRDGGNFRRLQFSHITFNCRHVHPCHWGKADPIFISCRHRDPAITPGEIGWVSFSHLTGVGEGAINLHSDTVGILHHISFDHLQFQQVQTTNDQQGLYDIRPPCNPEQPTGMGLDNAYRMNPKTGFAFGVQPYPNGLPAFYAQGVHLLHLSELTIDRPSPLPPGWNREAVVKY